MHQKSNVYKEVKVFVIADICELLLLLDCLIFVDELNFVFLEL